MSKRDIKSGEIVPNQFHSTSLHQHCSGWVEPILKTPQCFLLYCTGICFYCIRIVCETYKWFKNYILICIHCNLWVIMTKFLSGHMKLWKMRSTSSVYTESLLPFLIWVFWHPAFWFLNMLQWSLGT